MKSIMISNQQSPIKQKLLVMDGTIGFSSDIGITLF